MLSIWYCSKFQSLHIWLTPRKPIHIDVMILLISLWKTQRTCMLIYLTEHGFACTFVQHLIHSINVSGSVAGSIHIKCIFTEESMPRCLVHSCTMSTVVFLFFSPLEQHVFETAKLLLTDIQIRFPSNHASDTTDEWNMGNWKLYILNESNINFKMSFLAGETLEEKKWIEYMETHLIAP